MIYEDFLRMVNSPAFRDDDALYSALVLLCDDALNEEYTKHNDAWVDLLGFDVTSNYSGDAEEYNNLDTADYGDGICDNFVPRFGSLAFFANFDARTWLADEADDETGASPRWDCTMEATGLSAIIDEEVGELPWDNVTAEIVRAQIIMMFADYQRNHFAWLPAHCKEVTDKLDAIAGAIYNVEQHTKRCAV